MRRHCLSRRLSARAMCSYYQVLLGISQLQKLYRSYSVGLRLHSDGGARLLLTLLAHSGNKNLSQLPFKEGTFENLL